jgi:hypothetical protein
MGAFSVKENETSPPNSLFSSQQQSSQHNTLFESLSYAGISIDASLIRSFIQKHDNKDRKLIEVFLI